MGHTLAFSSGGFVDMRRLDVRHWRHHASSQAFGFGISPNPIFCDTRYLSTPSFVKLPNTAHRSGGRYSASGRIAFVALFGDTNAYSIVHRAALRPVNFYGDLLAEYAKPMVGILVNESRSCNFSSATSIEEVLYASTSTSSLNSGSNSRAQTLVEAGWIPLLIFLLSSTSSKVQCDALWALSYLCQFDGYAGEIAESGGLAVAAERLFSPARSAPIHAANLVRSATQQPSCQAVLADPDVMDHLRRYTFGQSSGASLYGLGIRKWLVGIGEFAEHTGL